MTDDVPGEPNHDEAAGQSGFGFDPQPESSARSPQAGYRVLARKYRPQSFVDLIGQDALVRTVTNAFASARIPQAWMLTGVRGVGKTTTARILARALNYDTGREGSGPTVDMPEIGIHCRAIMESRHIDVMEMDAASHTGVENIRQITDAVRYGPVQARYKVYIVDEVHMLSTPAFNAFLKTLEEPPPHAKFVFATTEIRKVPVTILSRCQRFDLRRVETGTLVAHLARICGAEDVEAEPDALAAIARAAEGSVRDALSLLDQAVAHGAGAVRAGDVRDMLGLADRGQVIELFEAVMRGDVPAAFATLRAGHEAGAEPRQMLEDLAQFTHLVTRLKISPDLAGDPSLTEAERTRGADFAARLSIRALSRAWQILLKAVPEVGGAPRPLAAAEMALVRLAYAADLPTPDDALRRLRDGVQAAALDDRASTRAGSGSGPLPGGPASTRAAPSRSGLGLAPQTRAVDEAPAVSPQPAVPPAGPRSFPELVALAGEKRNLIMKAALQRDVRFVRMSEGHLEVALVEGASRSLPNDIARALGEWTGRRWVVSVAPEAPGVETLDEAKRRREAETRRGLEEHSLVKLVLETWPGGEIVDVRERGAAVDSPLPAPDADEDERDAP